MGVESRIKSRFESLDSLISVRFLVLEKHLTETWACEILLNFVIFFSDSGQTSQTVIGGGQQGRTFGQTIIC